MKLIFLTLLSMSLLNLDAQDKKILFVCEQGTSKSMIAASYFNKLAEERKLPWRAEGVGQILQTPFRIRCWMDCRLTEFKLFPQKQRRCYKLTLTGPTK